MSWTEEVQCRRCYCNAWTVKDGVWTCPCGLPMHDARRPSLPTKEPKPAQEEKP